MGCEDCRRKRRGEPGLTVRVVQEGPTVVGGALYGLAVSLGICLGVKAIAVVWPKQESVV